jgi:hypothetical protein
VAPSAPGWWEDCQPLTGSCQNGGRLSDSPDTFRLSLGHRVILRADQPRRIGSVTGHSATRPRLAFFLSPQSGD